MKERDLVKMALLTIVTIGIYLIYWMVKTKGEMNEKGAEIPTAWLIIVPIANIWWLWKYSEGVEKVTNAKLSTVISFILLIVLEIIGVFVIQHTFNTESVAAPAPEAAPADPTPPADPAE